MISSKALFFSILLLVAGFSTVSSRSVATEPIATTLPTATPTATAASDTKTTAEAATQVKVITTMNSGGYTYVEYIEGGAKKWLAGPETTISVGDTVEYSGSMPMSNFTSKTLKKTFDKILFVSSLIVTDGAPIKLSKVENGVSVEECFKKINTLKDKTVTVKGKIVKLISGVMGKTWIHIQDGTGKADSKNNDLVITTKESKNAKVGAVVTATGKLSKDVDFGSGYFFSVIIQDAKIH